jgi:Domain of unknown function (DUF5666)
MKIRYLSIFVFALALAAFAAAQDSSSTPPAGQNPGQNSGQGGDGNGRRGGYGGGGMMGRGTMGTVTEAAADHYTIKTESGDVYTVHFDSNTRIVKQPAGGGMRGQGGGGQGGSEGMGRGNPPQQIKATDIKVGDVIRASGDVDATSKSIAARAVMQLDAATVQQMKEMEANFGKTWLAGKVTAIDGVKITLTGTQDNAAHTVVADENTTFRKRRDPVTLADIQVGDTVRVEGAVKDGVFAATTVSVGGMMGGGEGPGGPRNPPSQ